MTQLIEMEQETKISFASKSENIALVEKLINQVCETHKISEDHYGNKSNPGKKIDVMLHSSDKKISFTVKDQGDGFDFEALPDPTNPENIEKPHGRGVFLMRHLADTVAFEDNGST